MAEAGDYAGLGRIGKVRSLLYSFLRRVEVDRAVLYGILARAWSLLAGPVTALLIVTKFTPEVQGYYYTFGSILALQVFAELGLGNATIQFASHEWARLSLDKEGRIVGDRDSLSKLSSLAKIVWKWYFFAGVAVALGLGIGGYVFFASSPDHGLNWSYPWFALSLLTGLNLFLIPLWSLLEGCNQVTNVYRYRFFQGLFSNVSVWIAVLLDAGLWALAISSLVVVMYAVNFMRSNYSRFLKTLLFSRVDGPRIGWRSEVLPLQWRIALSWISGYFVFSLFIPVLFRYHGPVVAGQMGITWSLVGVLTATSGAWVSPKAPKFGMLIATRKWEELDRLFWKLTKIVAGVAGLGGAAIWAGVCLLYGLDHKYAVRVLPPLPTGLFLLATILVTVSMPMSTYLRAHKKEPLLALSVLAGIATGISTILLGKQYGATGMAAGYLLVNIFSIPAVAVIWYRFRARWHAPGLD